MSCDCWLVRLPSLSGNMLRLGIVAALGAPLGGCSELTSVNTADVVELSDLENRLGARALRAGAIARFTEAYTGNFFSQVYRSGLIADELTAAHPNDEYDRRSLPEIIAGGRVGPFVPLSTARGALLQGLSAMQRFDAASLDDIAELFALTGYVELFFAENFCSGVPLSSIENNTPVYGQQLTTVQMLQQAIANFESALATATTLGRTRSLASVGRARALLQLGHFSDAASASSAVPTDFFYQTHHDAGAVRNDVWFRMSQERAASVADREGENGLPFISAQDPRVASQLLGPGIDGETPVFVLLKYANANSPVVLASGIEARLIEAEALLHSGDSLGALAMLNELRRLMPELTPLSPESTAAKQVDQLFRERAFWLFATGHRHGDLRRLARQYGRDAESVFPSGAYSDGLEYGRDVTFGLPEGELSNPYFTGSCFSRDA